jgi:predicted dehydrogenase
LNRVLPQNGILFTMHNQVEVDPAMNNRDMSRITRRNFCKSTLGTGASLMLPACSSQRTAHTRIRGANQDIRVAVIGFHNKGKQHIRKFQAMKGVRVVALCDADQSILERELKGLQAQNLTVDGYQDMRFVMDRDDIDAIVIATPNHWHALATVWGCQTGKDVYVEKPVSHSIWEGQQMVKASRKYGRIVQSGTHLRSCTGLQTAIKYIKDGNLGAIRYAKTQLYWRRKSIGRIEKPKVYPSNVDQNIYCGPAPLEPLMRKNLHYDWHWQWNTGNGEIGNNAIHYFDLCRQAMGQDELAPSVMCLGGRYGYDDDGQTPNTVVAVLDYQPAPLYLELRSLPHRPGSETMDVHKSIRSGLIIACEGGYFSGSNGGGWIYDNNGQRIRQFKGDGGATHTANFIKAVRSRKPGDLKAEIMEGYRSTALCHMVNISYLLGHHASLDEIESAIRHDDKVTELCAGQQQHLALHNVNLNKKPPLLGPMLTLDAKKERFTGNMSKRANAMLRDEYRKPFVVPERI